MAKMMFDAPAEKAEDTPGLATAPESAADNVEEFEPGSVLAMGLPAAWSIEPPAIIVHRKTRAI